MKISRLDFLKGIGALFALPLLGKIPKVEEEQPELIHDDLEHNKHLKVHEDFYKFEPVYLPEDFVIPDGWQIDRTNYKWWQPESYTYTTTSAANPVLTLDNLEKAYKIINTT